MKYLSKIVTFLYLNKTENRLHRNLFFDPTIYLCSFKKFNLLSDIQGFYELIYFSLDIKRRSIP